MSESIFLPDQIFVCPQPACPTFSTTTHDAISHLRLTHSALLGAAAGIEIEKYITPTTLLFDGQNDSQLHICMPCSQLLRSNAAAKNHLIWTHHHTPGDFKQGANGVPSLHRLLHTVKFIDPEPEISVPTVVAPERIVYRQQNFVYGHNHEVIIVNEQNSQRATSRGKFIAVVLDHPHESDMLSGWYRVPPTHPKDTDIVYEQRNYIHGRNNTLTIANGPPPGTVFGDVKPSVANSITQFSYEQNNRIFGNNTVLQIECGTYADAAAERGTVKNVQTNWMYGTNTNLSAFCGGEERQLCHQANGVSQHIAVQTRGSLYQNASVSMDAGDEVTVRGNYD